MNRRGFLGRLGLLIAAVAVAPAIKYLEEPETVTGGLLWQIENSGVNMTYRELTFEDIEELIRKLDEDHGPKEQMIFISSNSYRNMRL